ncbi:MAG: hypothetical protein ABI634_11345 [Acidobacteriota bacterium]
MRMRIVLDLTWCVVLGVLVWRTSTTAFWIRWPIRLVVFCVALGVLVDLLKNSVDMVQ